MRDITPERVLAAVPQTMLDRVIGWFDPVRGAARLRGRAIMALGSGGYTGASQRKRSLSTWQAPRQSADSALMPDLETLRDRSRDLVRNNPLATGAINTVVTRVIGTGLAMRPRIDHELLGITREQADTWQRDAQRRWEAWAERTWCDAAKKLNFYQIQRLTLRSALEAGDTFALLPILSVRGRPNPLAIRLVEGDRIGNPRGERDTPRETGGVRSDENGAPTDYYIYREHPGSIHGTSLEGDWIPAFGPNTGRRNVLHVFDPLRPGQTRGVPYLAPVIEPLKQLGRYTDAEIDAAVVSSFFTVFTKTPGGEGLDPLVSAASGQTETSDTRKGQNWNGELSSGLVVDLEPGSDVEFADPSRPNQAFDAFVMAVLRQIGVALEIPFELLIKHFTSSYTAARAALLDFWLFVRGRREWMAITFCQPVYDEWLRLEVATGHINAPGFFSSPLLMHAWCGAEWVGDSMGVLDPQREMAAVEKALEIGLTTLDKETMKHDGSDWSDNHEQQVIEHNARELAGLTKKNVPAPALVTGAVADADPETDDDDNDDDTEV